MVLLLVLLCPLIVAEPFVYVHPVNPKLHPRDMFPIQKSVRGFNKIRDLPPSGIVYLDRIKPISEEFKDVVVHGNNTFVGNEMSVPLIQLQPGNNNASFLLTIFETECVEQWLEMPFGTHAIDTFEINSIRRQSMKTSSIVSDDTTSVETTSSTNPSSLPPTVNVVVSHTVESTVTAMPSTKPVKNLLKIAISKSSKNEKELDLSSEAQPSLLHLINYIKTHDKVDLIEDSPDVETIEIPKIVRTHQAGGWRRPGKHRAKLVPLSRTASVHRGAVIGRSNSAKLVQLKKKKSYGRVGGVANHDVEFDPWERVGTL